MPIARGHEDEPRHADEREEPQAISESLTGLAHAHAVDDRVGRDHYRIQERERGGGSRLAAAPGIEDHRDQRARHEHDADPERRAEPLPDPDTAAQGYEERRGPAHQRVSMA